MTPVCPICGGGSEVVGEKKGLSSPRSFVLRRCGTCQLGFVEDPWLDYAAIYDAAYYEGRGADPLVDYHFELAEPKRAIRALEWRGITRVVSHLAELDAKTRWLDYGCGNGGLVRHVRGAVGCEALGFEEGGIVPAAREAGVPILDRADLAGVEGSFDVVTSIEVLEHVADPVETLTRIRRLLRPGGVFFYTTGNARPFRDRLLDWSYFRPEIHISLYEPESMRRALERAGFETRQAGYVPGWDEIYAFKVLKNLKRRTLSPLYGAVPWRLLAPALNGRFGLYDFPIGVAN
jgi:SAM-dependent methyltransferase